MKSRDKRGKLKKEDIAEAMKGLSTLENRLEETKLMTFYGDFIEKLSVFVAELKKKPEEQNMQIIQNTIGQMNTPGTPENYYLKIVEQFYPEILSKYKHLEKEKDEFNELAKQSKDTDKLTSLKEFTARLNTLGSKLMDKKDDPALKISKREVKIQEFLDAIHGATFQGIVNERKARIQESNLLMARIGHQEKNPDRQEKQMIGFEANKIRLEFLNPLALALQDKKKDEIQILKDFCGKLIIPIKELVENKVPEGSDLQVQLKFIEEKLSNKEINEVEKIKIVNDMMKVLYDYSRVQADLKFNPLEQDTMIQKVKQMKAEEEAKQKKAEALSSASSSSTSSTSSSPSQSRSSSSSSSYIKIAEQLSSPNEAINFLQPQVQEKEKEKEKEKETVKTAAPPQDKKEEKSEKTWVSYRRPKP